MKKKPIKAGIQYRTATVTREMVNENGRTVEVAFSSETPVERFFGIEILDHSAGAVDLSRLNNGGPVLVDHDTGDQVGVIESARIDKDRMGRATLRFGQSVRAEEIFQDVLDGIRPNISVGYRVRSMVLEETEGKEETYRVTEWLPLEISFVSIPADAAVGVGRGAESEAQEIAVTVPEPEAEEASDRNDNNNETKTEKEDEAMLIRKYMDHSATEGGGAATVDVGAERSAATTAERVRIREIEDVAVKFGHRDMARKFIDEGKSADAFRAAVMDTYSPKELETPDLGMSDKEVREYSMVRAIHAASIGDWKNAGLEKEASNAYAERSGKTPKTFFVPSDVLKRDMTVGTATAGGHTVGTDLLSGSFIDTLKNAMQVVKLGATVLNDLNGNIAIPRKTGGGTAYWVAEGAAGSESTPAVDQVALSPKNVTAFSDFSRNLVLQSSLDVENFVRTDLAQQLALAVDLAAFNGSGTSNQPEGVLNASGIGDVAIGTNGGAPTYAHTVNLWKAVAQDNAAIGQLGFLTNAIMVAKLAQTEKFSSTGKTIIEDLPGSDGMTKCLGMNAAMSNQVPADLTKGSSSDCSAILFGNWRDLLIGYWGGLDVLVDPYSQATAGLVRVVAYQSADVAVRHAESFAAIQDARDV